MTKTSTPCGAWTSPLTAADVAAGSVRLSWPRLVGGQVWWLEGRPDEGGRTVLVRRLADGSREDLLPSPWDARTRVHEYGGDPWVDVPGAAVFAHFGDQRLWRVEPGGEPTPLTPEPAEASGARYADLVLVGDEVWCVRELHEAGTVSRALVAVPLDGSQQVRVLVVDRHFLARPQLSPDGATLAWIGWEHPQMPWDGTELRVAPVVDGVVGAPRTLLGSRGESVLPAQWVDDRTLLASTDRTGWWNLVHVDTAGVVTPLHPAEQEYGGPLWSTGLTWSVRLADGRVLALHGGHLGLIGADGEMADVQAPFTSWSPMLHTDGERVVTVAGTSARAPSIVVVDPDGGHEVAHVSGDAPVGPEWLPVPTVQVLPSARGRVVHAVVYPPTSPDEQVPDGELPPYLVFLHGGPTSQAGRGLDLQKAYFTSRGIGVVDVDYGGSTGYGRPYRDALQGQWGVVDVEDCVAAVQGLADAGLADRGRLLVRGGSAGGWTVLAALTRTDAFAAGASYFGVADALALAQDTHDFESRYLDGLVGPLPEALETYRERSPLARVDDLRCPVLLLQGAEDLVVPPAQAELFRDAMVRNAVPHAYLLFQGEQHGFRRAETVVAALEAELSFYGQVLGFLPPGVPVLPLVRPV